MSAHLHRRIERRLSAQQSRGARIPIRTVWLLLTRNCPHTCRHCYFCGAPGGETMTRHQAERIIDHLPRAVESIGISGGEIFTRRSLLHHVLDLIRERGFRSLTNVTVMTVGDWARSRAHAAEQVRALVARGVSALRVFGHDPWHWERGVRRERQEMLVDICRTDLGFSAPASGLDGVAAVLSREAAPVVSLGSTGPVLPVGRAEWATNPEERKAMPRGESCPFRPFLRLSPNGYYLTVNVNGEVHFCLFLLTRPLGNAVREPIVRMLRRARRDRYFRLLDQGTIPEFAEDQAGITPEEGRRRIAEQDACTFCIGVQRDLLAKRSDRPFLLEVIERERP
jgi:hypothetical protein